MVNYRRNFVPGGTYFFTVNLRSRQSNELVHSIALLRQAFRETLRAKPFHIVAIVVLPNHLHTIWTLPQDDADYPSRWRMIKSRFCQLLQKTGQLVEKRRDGSALIWQRRYWEHTIRDENDLNRHIDYIHFNPVKHGYVQQAADWSYSSFHQFVRKGLLPSNWVSTSSLDEAYGIEGKIQPP